MKINLYVVIVILSLIASYLYPEFCQETYPYLFCICLLVFLFNP